MKGLQFSSVSELLQSKNVPKVVKVVSCQQPQLSDGKKLEVDEVLLVRKVGKTMLRKPFLKVFSATKKEEKSINVRAEEGGGRGGVFCCCGVL